MAIQDRLSNPHLLLVLLMISLSCLQVQCGIQEFETTCNSTIDLIKQKTIYSGLLKMNLSLPTPANQGPPYPKKCDVVIHFSVGLSLLIDLKILDIVPKPGDAKNCSTGVEFYEGNETMLNGKRFCMDILGWIAEYNGGQGKIMQVQMSPLTVRLVINGPYIGTGYELHFNQISLAPCLPPDYKCQFLERCIHPSLVCDGENDCGDYSDESNNKCRPNGSGTTAMRSTMLANGLIVFFGCVALELFVHDLSV